MAFRDRPIVRRLLEETQTRTGLTVTPVREVNRLRMVEQEFGEFAQDAEELALHSLDYRGGRPQEMRPEKRRRLAQRSRVALIQDPLAGAEAEMLASFGFGKGVSLPTARNPDVQDVIDSAWTDPINEQVLCGYQAQRRLSNALLTSAELPMTLYTRGGKIRVGKRDPDRIIDVITDPENEQIPLWYVEQVPMQRSVWNYETGAYTTVMETNGGRAKLRYWPHWRNAADAEIERDRFGVEDDELPFVTPPDDQLAAGVMYFVAINQTGDGLRGNPPWARSLRFMNAMNVLTEAHVAMAQAASSFIAKRAMKGSARQITKAAESVLAQVSELGASSFRPNAGWGVAGNADPTSQPFTGPGQPGPFPPASWWNENMDSSNLQAMKLDSGSAQMAQSAQIVRAPIAAASQFGQHYLGDASDTNLATASTLELPATMRVGAWQEFFEQMYRWFTDRAIEAAVKAGLLGGADGFDGAKPLAEMRLHEAEDRAAMEKRTGLDLSYEFSMPFPGRRQLSDVTTSVQVVCQSMDPNGVNIALRRLMLKFFFEQIGIDDVARAVEECIPEQGMPGGIGPQQATGNAPGLFAGAPGQQGPPGVQPGQTGAQAGAGAADPGEGQQPYGAQSGTAAGGGSAGADGALEGVALEGEWLPDGAREPVDRMKSETAKLFRRLVGEPAMRELTGAGANGQR